MDKVMRVEIFHVFEDLDSNITYINAETRFMPHDDPAGVEKTIAQTCVCRNGFYIDKEDKFKEPIFKFTVVDMESAMKYTNESENQNQENEIEN